MNSTELKICNDGKWRRIPRNIFPVSENEQPCLHKSCPECNGTGRKRNGEMFVHHLSCPCPRCSPRMAVV